MPSPTTIALILTLTALSKPQPLDSNLNADLHALNASAVQSFESNLANQDGPSLAALASAAGLDFPSPTPSFSQPMVPHRPVPHFATVGSPLPPDETAPSADYIVPTSTAPSDTTTSTSPTAPSIAVAVNAQAAQTTTTPSLDLNSLVSDGISIILEAMANPSITGFPTVMPSGVVQDVENFMKDLPESVKSEGVAFLEGVVETLPTGLRGEVESLVGEAGVTGV